MISKLASVNAVLIASLPLLCGQTPQPDNTSSRSTCSVVLEESHIRVDGRGGLGEVPFSANGARCNFLSQQLQWLHVAFSPPGTTGEHHLMVFEAQGNYSTMGRTVTLPLAGVEVTFVQEPGKMRLAVAPGRLSFEIGPNGSTPLTGRLKAVSQDGTPHVTAVVREQDRRWLSVAPGAGTGDFEVRVNTAALGGQRVEGFLVVSADDAENSPIAVPIEVLPPSMVASPFAFAVGLGGNRR